MKAFVVDLDEREIVKFYASFILTEGGKVSLNTLIMTSKLFLTYMK